MNIRVALVDDHALIRLSLSHLLADVPGIDIIWQATSGEDALLRVRADSPDVLLMDLDMPGMGGHEAALRLLKTAPGVRIAGPPAAGGRFRLYEQRCRTG